MGETSVVEEEPEVTEAGVERVRPLTLTELAPPAADEFDRWNAANFERFVRLAYLLGAGTPPP